MAAMVARPLAAVPPDSPPRIARIRPFTRGTTPPSFALAVSWAKKTPSSKGMESKPQENTIRAPLFFAAAS